MTTIEEMIKPYHPKTIEETKSALREIVQSIVLVGLSRGGFFSKASFYGGTALRIFHGLKRFSEDLDFTLNEKNEEFSITPYIDKIKETAASYGLELEIQTKAKKNETPIESAFAKLNTYQTFIKLNINEKLTSLLHKDEVIKVKFEIDCNPPLGFNVESKWIDMPEFALVNVLDDPSLFAGKLHAVLCRNYKNTVKGRDYYDFIFYVMCGISPNLDYLRNKLIETKKITKDDEFNLEILKKMLKERFETVDFAQVKDDAMRFVSNPREVELYSKELFMQVADMIR